MEQQTRDKRIAREFRKLFWSATLQDKKYLIPTVVLHAPFFFINHVYTPLQIAYGLQAIFSRDFDAVSSYAIKIAVAAVVSNVLLAVATWAFNRHGIVVARYVQRRAFATYMNKDFDFFANNYVGALGVQVANLRVVSTAYEKLLFFDGPRVGVILGAGMAVLFIKAPLLASITLACIVAILSFTFVISRWRLKFRREVSEAESMLSGVLGDALSQGTTVKSFANEDYETKRLESATTQWAKAQVRSWDLFVPANGGRNLLLALATAVLLVVSGKLYADGTVSIAIIALVQIYVVKLINTSIDIGEMVKEYERIMSTSYAAISTMLEPTLVNDQAKPTKFPSGALTVALKEVQYHYPEAKSRQNALQNVSLSIKPGERIGVVGYSGSGKTTLSRLLLRFMDVTNGSISINGIDIKQLSQSELRRSIAYVPQEPLLFHRSILENIAYAAVDSTDDQITKAAKMAYVDEFVAELPMGYKTLVGERGVKLSGGQRQRVAIARALLKNAPILVMDEATSALDSHSESLIQDALWRLMKDRTTIVIAHRLSTIQKMDRIVVMDKGKVVEVGSHKQLLANKDGIYAQLWSHQSGGYFGVDHKETEDE